MKHDPMASGKRKAVNLSLDTGIVAAAREAGLNLSQVCEAALREASGRERAQRWREEHEERIEAVNAWIERNGMPLSDLQVL